MCRVKAGMSERQRMQHRRHTLSRCEMTAVIERSDFVARSATLAARSWLWGTLDLHFLFATPAIGHSSRHSIGTSIGAPLSLTKKPNILAGMVRLAFRPTT